MEKSKKIIPKKIEKRVEEGQEKTHTGPIILFRVDIGDFHGTGLATIHSHPSILTRDSRIFASIHEFGPGGVPIIGAARMTVLNVVPSNGSVIIGMKVDHPSDVRVALDLLVINPIVHG